MLAKPIQYCKVNNNDNFKKIKEGRVEYISLLLFFGHQGDATGIGILMKQGNFSLMHYLRGYLSLLDIFPLNFPMSISFLFFFLSHAFHSSLNTEKKLALPTLIPKFVVL